MIPLIFQVENFEEVNTLLTEIAQKNNINSYDIIQVKPEKKELVIEQIKELQTYISRSYTRPILVAFVGVDASGEEVQNALLKLLEEESKRFLFVLFIQNYYALNATIRSRCKTVQMIQSSAKDLHSSKKEIDDWQDIYTNMSVYINISKDETIQLLDSLLISLPEKKSLHKAYIIKHVLFIRNMIQMNNMNHILGLDSVLLFLSKISMM